MDSTNASQKKERAFQNGYAPLNGIKMYYEIHGEGEPLVLIHGGGSTINSSFGRILPYLSSNRKVIAVEMQAHGRTSDREAPESFQQDASDIVELLKFLKIEQADILGFSNGGQTAMEVAIKYPASLHKLVLASAFYKRSAAPAGFWESFKNANIENMPPVLKEEFFKVNKDPAAFEAMFKKDVQRMYSFTDWKDEDLKKIKAPTLVLMGDQDVASPEHAVEMFRLIPKSRLAILPGNHGNYMGEIMSPDPGSKKLGYFADLLNDFLSQPTDK